MGIGKNIKMIRSQSGMDQHQLAERLNVSNKTISSWERERTEPRMGMIEQMSEIFNCSKADLIEGVDYRVRTDPQNVEIETKNNLGSFERSLLYAYTLAPDGIKESVKKLLDLK
jgi:transcriptional regulator with XRE-family HTH domain